MNQNVLITPEDGEIILLSINDNPELFSFKDSECREFLLRVGSCVSLNKPITMEIPERTLWDLWETIDLSQSVGKVTAIETLIKLINALLRIYPYANIASRTIILEEENDNQDTSEGTNQSTDQDT